MACSAQLIAMQYILLCSLYVTGRLKKPMLDAAHLAVENVHIHPNAAHVDFLFFLADSSIVEFLYFADSAAMLLDPHKRAMQCHCHCFHLLANQQMGGASLLTSAMTLFVLKEIDATAAKQVIADSFLFLVSCIAAYCACTCKQCSSMPPLATCIVPCLLLFGVVLHAKQCCCLSINQRRCWPLTNAMLDYAHLMVMRHVKVVMAILVD